MKTYQKIMLGGLGALMPVIMNLLVVDLHILFLNLTLVALLAYFTRVVILFFLGGLVAFLHKDENSPFKLLQLGVAAPALITGLLNGAQVELPKVPLPAEANPSASTYFVPPVYAQPTRGTEVKTFSLPKETLGEQVQRGLIGSVPTRVWFVIVGSYSSQENAERSVKQIEREFGPKGFKPVVYAPYGGNPYWAVVIGSNLSSQEAQQLQQRAITAGLPKDTYLWTFAK